jgi:predicted nucleic acid-binding protein
VDTSVWIDYFRGDSATVASLDALIDAGRVRTLPLVIGELLRGSKNDSDQTVLADLDRVFPRVPESAGAWLSAGLLCARLHESGLFPGLADAFIAICASEAGVAVWTRDAHFAQLRDAGSLSLALL